MPITYPYNSVSDTLQYRCLITFYCKQSKGILILDMSIGVWSWCQFWAVSPPCDRSHKLGSRLALDNTHQCSQICFRAE